MTSLLTGKIIAIYYKANNDAVSEILFAAVPIDAMKKYSPKMRKVFTKYPTNKFYTITGGAKYAYSLAIKHILACCKARVIYQINKRDFVDCGNAYNAFKDLEINHFANYIHGGMEKMAAKPIIPSMIEEIYHEFDDEHGAWVRAMVVKGVAEAKYYGRIDKVAVAKYHAENICNELHEDVRKVLAELQAGSKVNNHGKAEGIHCHSVNDTNIQHELV
jgi:hypothetical protein